ncbi:signal peptidase I [Neorickettsia sp. 179522]|uniref:signal peptidase I n=1 Tax=Neorickettsia sp. 179522 TaxID=1714371 RepID=UPI000797223D|nr:signal peptidase I [Neorickettsia sp. 179522]KYH12747.1 S26 family signal peptidase [Neorickettsia sp. 179522]
MTHSSKILHTLRDACRSKTLWLIIGLILVRSLFYEPFIIPSGSMKKTLLAGDYIVASKYAYGYSKYSFPFSPSFIRGNPRIFYEPPKRGDVVVFRNPHKDNTNYIKRIIGLPGDKIQLIGGRVYVNHKPIERAEDGVFMDSGTPEIQCFVEILDSKLTYPVLQKTTEGPANNTGTYHVPQGHFFVLGDNRDNSTDSRFLASVGFIPAEYLVGRAERILLSFGTTENRFIPIKLRLERTWKSLRPEELAQKKR